MKLFQWLVSSAIVIDRISAQDTTSSSSTTKRETDSSSSTSKAEFSFYTETYSTISNVSVNAFTGTRYSYASPTGQQTVGNASYTVSSAASFTASTSSSNSSSTTSTKQSLTQLVGSSRTSNSTASRTSSSARPTNTVPCNGYPEFCNRQYSNITQVCAHNSAFVVKNNAGSNQALPVTTQLEDGIRMIQGETHYVNDTIMNCHTSCSLLNAGTWQSELETVAEWLRKNPYEVVTWLIVNSDFVNVEKYVPAIRASGIGEFLYEPEFIPQHRSQWPTLGELILSGKRVVMFMDYKANQTAVPYIMDEFTHIWETPFSPTDQSFPCTQQRPPDLNQTKARDEYMYLANHNLNTAVDLSALLGTTSGQTQILIPNTAEINQTNGLYNQFGQLGAMSLNCTKKWGRPPNFLLVDYYNYGDPYQGSVFEVAARANGVKYNKNSCCGTTSAAPKITLLSPKIIALIIGLYALVLQ